MFVFIYVFRVHGVGFVFTGRLRAALGSEPAASNTKNTKPPNKSPVPTAVGRFSSAVAVNGFRSAVAQLSTLGIKIGLTVELVWWRFAS